MLWKAIKFNIFMVDQKAGDTGRAAFLSPRLLAEIPFFTGRLLYLFPLKFFD